jgi:hypothetical protein
MLKNNVLLKCLVLTCVVLLSTGCTVLKLVARSNQPIMLNTPPYQHVVLGHFKKSKGVAFDYTGAPDISGLVREGQQDYPGGDAVSNTFVSVEKRVGDFFLDLFTLGFAGAYTITVEGDVIKYQQ